MKTKPLATSPQTKRNTDSILVPRYTPTCFLCDSVLVASPFQLNLLELDANTNCIFVVAFVFQVPSFSSVGLLSMSLWQDGAK